MNNYTVLTIFVLLIRVQRKINQTEEVLENIFTTISKAVYNRLPVSFENHQLILENEKQL